MAYLCIDLFKFPNEEIEKKFEDACAKWQPGRTPSWPLDPAIIFIGRMARDPLGKYTHAIVYKYEDFAHMKKTVEEYADTLETSSKPEGDFPGYLFSDWWGFRVVGLNDSIVKEHGIEEWTRRELTDHPPVFKNPARAAQWIEAINNKLQQLWPKDALQKAGWIIRPPNAPK